MNMREVGLLIGLYGLGVGALGLFLGHYLLATICFSCVVIIGIQARKIS